MNLEMIVHPAIVTLFAALARLPFIRFPMDEDFATWTYRARFALKGLKWKQDMFCFYPTWRMHLLDVLYQEPKNGVLRIRAFLATMHVLGSLIIFFFSENLTGNTTAAFLSAGLYAFFATAPAYSAESFNFEQIYVPLIIAGLYGFSLGPNWIFFAGLCFGFAVIPKVSTGIFFPGMIALTAWQYGLPEMATFVAAAVAPVIASHIIEWCMGYLDAESKRQFNLRLAVTLRCSRLKQMYGSIRCDIFLILNQTLPFWIFGPIGLAVSWDRPEGPLLFLHAITTFIMILCQRGFSRYHYFPMMAVWAIPSAIAFDWILNADFQNPALFFLFSIIIWSAAQILPFYMRPLETRQMARYEKFDQWLYVPHLGKLLQRYFRMKGEREGRLFVWGNYVQLYHLTGKPAADQYVHYAMGPWDDPIFADFFDTLIGGLLKHRPSCFVKTFLDFDIDLLKEISGLDYRLMKVVLGRFPVYRLETFHTPSHDPLSFSTEEKLKLLEALTRGDHVPGISRLDEKRGRFPKALAELCKLVKRNPWDEHGHFALAELNERMGKTEAAAQAFEKLIVLKPKHPYYRTRLAKLKLDQGKLDEAEHLIEAESHKFGNTAAVYFHRGLLARIQGAITEAESHFRSALGKDPDGHDCRLNLAELAREKGAIEQARNFYEELWSHTLNLDWMRTQAALGLAACDIRIRSKSETLAIYHHRDPQNEPLAYALASELEYGGHEEEARQRFAKYTQQFRQHHIRASAWFRLGRLAQGENQISYLMHCLRLNPAHDEARRLLKELDVCRVKA